MKPDWAILFYDDKEDGSPGILRQRKALPPCESTGFLHVRLVHEGSSRREEARGHMVDPVGQAWSDKSGFGHFEEHL